MKKRDKYIVVAILVAVALAFVFLNSREGAIQLDAPGATLTLRSGFFTSVQVEGDNRSHPVKARTYRSAYLNLESDGYQLSTSGPFSDMSRIHVEPGQTRSFKAGPPFLLKAHVRRNGMLVSLDYDILGRAGEQYTHVMRNNNRIPAPTVEIIDEAGEVLNTGQFEYG